MSSTGSLLNPGFPSPAWDLTDLVGSHLCHLPPRRTEALKSLSLSHFIEKRFTAFLPRVAWVRGGSVCTAFLQMGFLA